jgi:nucleotide-binding universal stress UspA family protein
MYKKLLVPLDGSDFSECSLEHVKTIALGCNIPEVILLRVVEPLSSNEIASLAEARGDLITQVEREQKADAEDYIAAVTSKSIKEGISARGEIAFGRAADKIMDYAKANQVDLIVISSHGRSGISRWAMGSVADKVMRYSTVPVLISSPSGCRVNQS